MTKTIIGIDPGASGALSFTQVGLECKSLLSYKCHKEIHMRVHSILLASKFHDMWNESEKTIAYVEKVHAMPHDGRSSLFKFGVNYGVWLGILHSSRYIDKIVGVSPQKWMKFWETKLGIKLPKVKKDRKNKLKEIASEYTEQKVTLWNADAILITMYGKYMEEGDNENV